MARSYGSSSSLLLVRETTYGTKPGGNWLRMPFSSCALGSSQELVESDTLGQGREGYPPQLGVINVEGDLAVPLEPRALGVWLTAILGDPVTTGTGPYTHTWESGADDLPSYSVEVGHEKVPAYFVATGARFDSFALDFQRSGLAKATIKAIAQGETKYGTTQGGTPQELLYTPFSQFQGAIKKDGVALANLTKGSLTYSNTMEKIETIRSDGLIDGVDPTLVKISGSLAMRFADTTLLDLATAGTPVELEFSYTISASLNLVVTAHELYLSRPKTSITGPGGVEASFDFQGAKDATLGKAMTVQLINDLDGSDYA